MRRRRNLGNIEGSDAERLWKEQEHTKHGQTWLRVKTLSLDEFHVIRYLGTGFYGPVRLVKNKNTGNLYVLKAYNHTGEAEDEQVIQTLTNERTLLLEVNSVWVERLYHSVQDSHFHFVYLEYIPGGNLYELMQQEGSLQEHQVRFYGAEMLMAINVIHRYGFMHRNIQPSNFVIDQFGHLKLVDFGTSLRFMPAVSCVKMATELSFMDGKPFLSKERRDRVKIYQRKTMNTTVGRKEFMAPEVVRKRPKGFMTYIQPADPATNYSYAADFWSFGVCVYYFLYGQLPFVGKDKKKLVEKIVSWRETLTFPIVQPISDEAKDLMNKLLCDEPYRLGVDGCEDVMSHTFFDATDWPRLRDWPVPVPYQPSGESYSDTSITPPACIADLFQAANKTSNNNNVSATLQPYIEDIRVTTSTCIADLFQTANTTSNNNNVSATLQPCIEDIRVTTPTCIADLFQAANTTSSNHNALANIQPYIQDNLQSDVDTGVFASALIQLTGSGPSEAGSVPPTPSPSAATHNLFAKVNQDLTAVLPSFTVGVSCVDALEGYLDTLQGHPQSANLAPASRLLIPDTADSKYCRLRAVSREHYGRLQPAST
ncbi:hypothetical protein ACOMHN_007589 [Nucella lapillus]